MNGWDFAPWILLILALLFSYGCIENFARFEDTSQRKRTDALVDSSYAQQTNHAIPQTGQYGPIQGIETPFRVNMHNAHL
jgi:hypothetical protein